VVSLSSVARRCLDSCCLLLTLIRRPSIFPSIRPVNSSRLTGGTERKAELNLILHLIFSQRVSGCFPIQQINIK
jgi:hypothetical protein